MFLRQLEILKTLSETMDPQLKNDLSKSSTVFTKRLLINSAALV